VGWFNDRFWTAAVRVDPDLRQDVSQFHQPLVDRSIDQMRKRFPANRVVEHLAENCASDYSCRAAQNFFLNRWECPVPASPACNATCLGCISLQEDDDVHSAHFRLKFIPDPNEIAEMALYHLESAPYPIVSFGQGCEGEPLLVWETLVQAIQKIRAQTSKGIINMNTNGSKPDAVEALCQAGLQSIRVSMNSARKDWYTNYYLPRNYAFEDIVESLKVVRKHGGWASINYFVFPGVTDARAEWEALQRLIESTDLNMIQWRNFTIDPDWYFKKVRLEPDPEPLGVLKLQELVRTHYPNVAFGYFNPSEETQAYYNERRTR
jgi:pyruvate-formate lyase-activating enzyme